LKGASGKESEGSEGKGQTEMRDVGAAAEPLEEVKGVRKEKKEGEAWTFKKVKVKSEKKGTRKEKRLSRKGRAEKAPGGKGGADKIRQR